MILRRFAADDTVFRMMKLQHPFHDGKSQSAAYYRSLMRLIFFEIPVPYIGNVFRRNARSGIYNFYFYCLPGVFIRYNSLNDPDQLIIPCVVHSIADQIIDHLLQL